jgi:putative spermidine/putrescine transport system ATP-binding protein
MPYLELASVTKHYRSIMALTDLSLNVDAGELMCLLGPSGCGKTTTLRIIAGFESVDRGHVRLGGDDITRVPPQKRDIGVVFQNYALFPHLTVNQNVGFGLAMRNQKRVEIAAAVRETLRLVRLDGVGDRLPRQLSGGQQQRVALARAIAIRPRLLLLDEPLSNLDAKLRDEMRDEIRRVQRAVGITTVFVTHDQIEALALADRMAVMDHGRVVQVDNPVNVYEWPKHPFVASFIGQANLLRGTVTAAQGEHVRFETASSLAIVGVGRAMANGCAVIGVVTSERIRLSRGALLDVANVFPGRIESRTYLGASIHYRCVTSGEKLLATEPNRPDAVLFEPGAPIFVSFLPADCLVLVDERTNDAG